MRPWPLVPDGAEQTLFLTELIPLFQPVWELPEGLTQSTCLIIIIIFKKFSTLSDGKTAVHTAFFTNTERQMNSLALLEAREYNGVKQETH